MTRSTSHGSVGESPIFPRHYFNDFELLTFSGDHPCMLFRHSQVMKIWNEKPKTTNLHMLSSTDKYSCVRQVAFNTAYVSFPLEHPLQPTFRNLSPSQPFDGQKSRALPVGSETHAQPTLLSGCLGQRCPLPGRNTSRRYRSGYHICHCWVV
jgi:hypothetical protein